VWSPVDPKGTLVLVTDQQITRVGEGQAPTTPEAIDDATFESYQDGLQAPGDGLPESLAEAYPVLTGGAVPLPDRAEPVTGVAAQGPAGDLGGGVPNTEGFPEVAGPSIGDVLKQPVAEVNAAGSVRVGF